MSAIQEGKSAYILGSDPNANPYRKAKKNLIFGFWSYQLLVDWECQWDSGYAIAKRNKKL